MYSNTVNDNGICLRISFVFERARIHGVLCIIWVITPKGYLFFFLSVLRMGVGGRDHSIVSGVLVPRFLFREGRDGAVYECVHPHSGRVSSGLR